MGSQEQDRRKRTTETKKNQKKPKQTQQNEIQGENQTITDYLRKFKDFS